MVWTVGIGPHYLITAEGAKPSDSWLTIVGVSPTVRQRDLREPDPIVYLPLRAAPAAIVSLMARSRASPDTLGSTLREAVRRLDPDVPLYRVMTLDRAIEDARWNGRLSSTLAVSISLIAVALAAVGLYAVTAHAVAQNMPEIGVRIALGAQPSHLAWMTLKGAHEHPSSVGSSRPYVDVD